MDSYDYSIDEMTKILVYRMKYGVRISDEDILLIAGSFFDKHEKNYEAKKLCFLENIHRILGK